MNKPDFRIIPQTDISNSKMNEKQRKEMISVLRNNSKILSQKERTLNCKIHKKNTDDNNKSQYLKPDNKLNQQLVANRNPNTILFENNSRGKV